MTRRYGLGALVTSRKHAAGGVGSTLATRQAHGALAASAVTGLVVEVGAIPRVSRRTGPPPVRYFRIFHHARGSSRLQALAALITRLRFGPPLRPSDAQQAVPSRRCPESDPEILGNVLYLTCCRRLPALRMACPPPCGARAPSFSTAGARLRQAPATQASSPAGPAPSR